MMNCIYCCNSEVVHVFVVERCYNTRVRVSVVRRVLLLLLLPTFPTHGWRRALLRARGASALVRLGTSDTILPPS